VQRRVRIRGGLAHVGEHNPGSETAHAVAMPVRPVETSAVGGRFCRAAALHQRVAIATGRAGQGGHDSVTGRPSRASRGSADRAPVSAHAPPTRAAGTAPPTAAAQQRAPGARPTPLQPPTACVPRTSCRTPIPAATAGTTGARINRTLTARSAAGGSALHAQRPRTGCFECSTSWFHATPCARSNKWGGTWRNAALADCLRRMTYSALAIPSLSMMQSTCCLFAGCGPVREIKAIPGAEVGQGYLWRVGMVDSR